MTASGSPAGLDSGAVMLPDNIQERTASALKGVILTALGTALPLPFWQGSD